MATTFQRFYAPEGWGEDHDRIFQMELEHMYDDIPEEYRGTEEDGEPDRDLEDTGLIDGDDLELPFVELEPEEVFDED